MIILTEKPSVSRAFAQALGVPQKDGVWENSGYCIVNAQGHLLETYGPDDYDAALKKWSLDTLPVIPQPFKYKPVAETQKQLAIVKACFDRRKGDCLLLATDAEREGELIGAEILEYVGFTNYTNARRFWVSEALTPQVVLAGIEKAKPLADYSSYRDQGFARQQADWLVGINLTRLITLKCGKLLHFGRVQTAVLGAIFERDMSISNFTSQKYFEVMAVLGDNLQFSVKLLNPDNGEFPMRFSGREEVFTKIQAQKNSFKTGVITDLQKEKKTVHPPLLFNLTALQKEAHKKFALSPEQTLGIAQELYEKHRCLSYPRTPSCVMGDDNVELVKSIYDSLAGEGKAGTDPALISKDNKRLFNSAQLEDHHALIPLTNLPENCSDDERNVFNLVLQRFFDLLKPPYIYNSVKISTDISDFRFCADGIEVVQQGWKSGKEQDEDEETQESFAGLEKDASYNVKSVETLEKKTEPKRRFTYASLLQLMENPRNTEGSRLAGLGTPATRGNILKKLVDRNYISVKGKNISITDDGAFLIGNVIKNDALGDFISIPKTTAWEEQLRDDTAAFLEGVKAFIRGAVSNTSLDVYQTEKSVLGKCPLCKSGNVYEGKSSFYCGNYKEKEPCRFALWKDICSAAVSSEDAQKLLAGKSTPVKKCKGKTGKDFKAAFSLVNGKVEFLFPDKK